MFWRRRTFDPPNTTFTGQADEPVINVDTPLNYFRKFIAPIMLDKVVESTNQYSIQKVEYVLTQMSKSSSKF